VAQVCALVRYTVLARLLGPEQLGLAATLVVTAQFFESISDSGSDRFLIQDLEGDSIRVQRFVQLLLASRGVLVAACLICFSGLLATFYGAPALAPAFVFLAAAPLIYGFLNLDMRRLQRHNDFQVEGVALLLSESASVLVTVIAAFATRDFTAIIYGLVTRSLVVVIVSHAMAKRRYGLGFAKEVAVRLAGFAAPLMLNGLLVFFGSQGDRLLVAKRLGAAELGHYSAVLLLIYYPSGILLRYLTAMHLPKVAASRSDPAAYNRAVDAVAGQALLVGILMSCGFTAVGPTAIAVLFGGKFVLPTLTICLVGVLQSVRFIRLWPNTVALGIGRSGIVLANNIARMIGLPAALAGASLFSGLPGMLVGLIGGEFAALAAALVMLSRQGVRPRPYDFDRFAIVSAAAILEVAWVVALTAPTFVEVGLLLAASVGLGFWTATRERLLIGDLVSQATRLWTARDAKQGPIG
jgi:O-antigen/teichoic acid export membrane protein